VRIEDRFAPDGIAIRRRPSAIWVIAVFVPATGSLDHAVERDVFDDFEFSHLASRENLVRCASFMVESQLLSRSAWPVEFRESGDNPLSGVMYQIAVIVDFRMATNQTERRAALINTEALGELECGTEGGGSTTSLDT
jgi:hypothetical protein